MAADVIHSPEYRQMRSGLKVEWREQNRACELCRQRTIDWDGRRNEPDSFELHHPLSRKRYPHLALDPRNAVPTHSRCNRAAGADNPSPEMGETDEEW